MAKDNYDANDVVGAPWMKWGKKGDKIFGTLISREEREQVSLATGQKEMVTVYEIKADGGVFHNVDDDKKVIEPGVEIKEGDVVNVSDHYTIHGAMKNVKLGQKIKIEFTETKPSQKKGNAPMKIRQVFSKGEMDQEWLKAQEEATKVSGSNEPW